MLMAGARGIEPRSLVLETGILTYIGLSCLNNQILKNAT